MNKKFLEKQIKDTVDKYSSAIDQVLQPESDCAYKRYKSLKEGLIKEVIKFRYSIYESMNRTLDTFKVREFNEDIILENARQFDEIASKLLDSDSTKEKIGMLESYFFDSKELLESYLNEDTDLGRNLQRLSIKSLIEKLVIITEGCKKKKKKKQ